MKPPRCSTKIWKSVWIDVLRIFGRYIAQSPRIYVVHARGQDRHDDFLPHLPHDLGPLAWLRLCASNPQGASTARGDERVVRELPVQPDGAERDVDIEGLACVGGDQRAQRERFAEVHFAEEIVQNQLHVVEPYESEAKTRWKPSAQRSEVAIFYE